VTTGGRVAVLVDSSAGIDPELAGRWNVGVVPLSVELDHRVYLDGQVPVEAWRSGAAAAIRTSPPTPGQFLDALDAACRAGASAVLVATVSASISSGTYHAALAAARARTEATIAVLDFGQAAGGLALTAAAAAEAAATGASLSDVADAARAAASRIVLFLAADEAVFAASARRPASSDPKPPAAGSVPILTVHDGGLVMSSLAASFEDALTSMTDGLRDRPSRVVRALVMHGPEATTVALLQEELRTLVGGAPVAVSRISDAVVANAGPRVVGLAVQFADVEVPRS
jgi:fatty acid-binding protein DegV